MRAYFTAGLVTGFLLLVGCGSADDAGPRSALEPLSETGGASFSLEATGGNAPALTGATGGEAATGGGEATGGAGDQLTGGGQSVTTGGQAHSTGGAATGGNAATGGASSCVGGLGCPCRAADAKCNAGLACHPSLNECVTIPACAGRQGFTCLYGPCTDGSTCYPEHSYTCGTPETLGGATGIALGPVLDCASKPAECTTHAGC